MVEHFVTLFDSNFLPQGIALYRSLTKQKIPFCLWVICMDDLSEATLRKLSFPNVELIPLREIESTFPSLLEKKADKSKAEYCWTITPFTFSAVFRMRSDIPRVTYVDADVYAFGNPLQLIQELEETNKAALITDHAYAPEYQQENTSGRFCVQFVTLTNTNKGREIAAWWQDQCAEWCYARFEDGKFGDQKYIEQWPLLWPCDVHILANTQLTLAPWNASHLFSGASAPRGIFHFHGLRIFSNKIRLWSGYRINSNAMNAIYRPYISELNNAIQELEKVGVEFNVPPAPSMFNNLKDRFRSTLRRTESWIKRN